MLTSKRLEKHDLFLNMGGDGGRRRKCMSSKAAFGLMSAPRAQTNTHTHTHIHTHCNGFLVRTTSHLLLFYILITKQGEERTNECDILRFLHHVLCIWTHIFLITDYRAHDLKEIWEGGSFKYFITPFISWVCIKSRSFKFILAYISLLKFYFSQNVQIWHFIYV
jgi:hypothetical protein